MPTPTVIRGSTLVLELVVEPVTPGGPVPTMADVLADIINPSAVQVVTDAVATEDPSPPEPGTARWTYAFAVPEDAALGNWTIHWTATVNGEARTSDEAFTVTSVPFGSVIRGSTIALELVIQPVTPGGPVPVVADVLVDIIDPAQTQVITDAPATEDPSPPEEGTARWTYDFEVAEGSILGDWIVHWTATVNGSALSADETFLVISVPFETMEIAPKMVTLSSLATRYVSVPTSTIDPLGLPIALAFTLTPDEPEAGDWISASWKPGGPPWSAQVLVGPGGDAVLLDGTYWIWTRVLADPEVVVEKVGRIRIS